MDGIVFAIHRNDFHVRLPCGGHHNLASGHHDFLIGQRDLLSLTDGRISSRETHHAYGRGNDYLRVCVGGNGVDASGAILNFRNRRNN